jgi:hypothetical protein
MIKKLIVTGIVLYTALALMQGVRAARSPEAKHVFSYLESTSYIGNKVNEEHPEFYAELKNDPKLSDDTKNIADLVDANESGSALGWADVIIGEARDRRYSDSIKNAGIEITRRHPTYFLGLATRDKKALAHMGNIAKLEKGYEEKAVGLTCKLKRVYMPWKNCNYN